MIQTAVLMFDVTSDSGKSQLSKMYKNWSEA